MKGPYERLKYDMRRVWECPECHQRLRTSGDRTFCVCDCREKRGGRPVVMKLIEEGGRARFGARSEHV
jgi:hypothetical protein